MVSGLLVTNNHCVTYGISVNTDADKSLVYTFSIVESYRLLEVLNYASGSCTFTSQNCIPVGSLSVDNVKSFSARSSYAYGTEFPFCLTNCPEWLWTIHSTPLHIKSLHISRTFGTGWSVGIVCCIITWTNWIPWWFIFGLIVWTNTVWWK